MFESNPVPIKTILSYPVTLSEAKVHLRIDPSLNDDDAYISTLVNVATQLASNYIEKDIARTRNTLSIEGFIGSYVEINEGNFLQIESAVDDSSTLINGYETTTYNNKFSIEFSSTISSDPLKINYITGYDPSVNACPDLIKQVILIKIGDLYDTDRSSYIFGSIKDTGIFERILNYYKGYYI